MALPPLNYFFVVALARRLMVSTVTVVQQVVVALRWFPYMPGS